MQNIFCNRFLTEFVLKFMGISVKCVKVKFLHFAFVLYCLEYQIHRASTGLLNDDPFSTPAMWLSISMLAKLKYVIKTVPTKNPFTPTRKHVLSAVQNSFLHNSCLHWSLSASNLALWKIQVNDRLEIQFFSSLSVIFIQSKPITYFAGVNGV